MTGLNTGGAGTPQANHNAQFANENVRSPAPGSAPKRPAHRPARDTAPEAAEDEPNSSAHKRQHRSSCAQSGWVRRQLGERVRAVVAFLPLLERAAHPRGARLHLGRAETQDVATSAKFEVDWLTAGSKWKESAKVTISVETKTTYGAELLAEIRDYYEPIETHLTMTHLTRRILRADDASDDVRRGEVEKLRRKRWREREQAAHWGRAHH